MKVMPSIDPSMYWDKLYLWWRNHAPIRERKSGVTASLYRVFPPEHEGVTLYYLDVPSAGIERTNIVWKGGRVLVLYIYTPTSTIDEATHIMGTDRNLVEARLRELI